MQSEGKKTDVEKAENRPDYIFYENFEKQLSDYAASREDIRAVAVIGSRARSEHPADLWSDMDIVVYTKTPGYYLGQHDWISELGEVLCSFLFQSAGNDSERLTLFEGGWQVDFVIHTYEELCRYSAKSITPNNFYRGVRILIDKDRLCEALLPDHFQAPKGLSISQENFNQIANMFWFSALYIGKQLMRGEVWGASMRDHDSKELLLQMIEWTEKLRYGAEYDTWHGGRFLHMWASPEIQSALSKCFGHYDREDAWNALSGSAKLFFCLSKEVAEKMQYSRPEKLENFVLAWIEENRMTE